MNDSIIINAISKIQFILVSIFSFIFLTLFALFIVLQNGIFLDTLSFQNIKVSKLYIKWDEKITLSADEIFIAKNTKIKASETNYEKIIDTVKESLPFILWFENIFIEQLSVNDEIYLFEYTNGKKDFLLSSSDFVLNGSLLSDKNQLHVKIYTFKTLHKDIEITGDLLFDLKKEFKLNAKLDTALGKESKFRIIAQSDAKKLTYKIESDNNIKNSREIVDLFDINPDIKYWIYDAIEMSSLSLNEFHGSLEYKNIEKAYLNIYAKAVANDLVYTYDQKVDSVRTKSTDLEFKDGILYIKPQNAYSYNFFLDKSWLKIDFSKQEELLTLYLIFKGKVNKELLSLLERYEIELPFIQNRGEIDANLTLDINLITLGVDAIGDFYAKEAQINYLGLDIDLFDAKVYLNNYDVKVENMGAKYGDIASSQVDLYYDANKSSGTLTFKFDNIDVNGFKLIKSKDLFAAAYIISPKQDYLTAEESKWNFKGKDLHLDAMQIPFDIKNLRAKIPHSKLEVPDLLSAFVSGEVLFGSKKADLNIELSKFNFLDISLDQKSYYLNLLYESNKIELSSKESLKLEVSNKKATIDDFMFEVTSEYIKAKDLSINFEDIIKSKINARFNIADASVAVDLKDFKLENEEFGNIFAVDENIELFVTNKDNGTFIRCDQFDLDYIFDNNGWKFELKSIDKLAKYSENLSKYNLTNGKFLLYKKDNEEKLKFSLNTDYKHKILVVENTPVEKYYINGEYSENEGIKLKINDFIDIKIKNDIYVKTSDIGINLDELLNFIADKNSSAEEDGYEQVNKKSKNLYFEADNSYIYLSENRHILSDKIYFKYIGEDLEAKLTHRQGKATLKLYKDVLNLYGKNFDDEFMGKLFSLSKFKGGTLEFYINGSTKEYNGTLLIKDTTILDYKILNNILAFVNTVPSLVTFSLPGYNQNGIAAESAYMNFKYKDDIYKIEGINLKSKEIEIVGLGEASIKNNYIDMDLNLITGLGSYISKIPFIGHILLGKENLSTTLKLSGTLDNPDVNTHVTKDIAVAPFNIIKRTLMYPVDLFRDEEKE